MLRVGLVTVRLACVMLAWVGLVRIGLVRAVSVRVRLPGGLMRTELLVSVELVRQVW